jgi:hypothetical protein
LRTIANVEVYEYLHALSQYEAIAARMLHMSKLPAARWWTVRSTHSNKPATYRCPVCGRHLPALSEHVLMFPEDDKSRRRHAHTKCVLAARQRGELLLREDWLRKQPRPPSLWRRLLGRVKGA